MILVVLTVVVRVGCTTRFIVRAALAFFSTTLERSVPRNSYIYSHVTENIIVKVSLGNSMKYIHFCQIKLLVVLFKI